MIGQARPRRLLAVLRWSTAGLAVVAAHGGLAWVGVNWRPSAAEAAAGAPEPAIMIELAAVSVAPEAPAETLPPAPERVEPETPPEPVKETPPPEPEPPPPPPEPVMEQPVEPPPPEPTPVQAPEPEIKLPDLPTLPDAAAVLAPPPPERPKEIAKPVERKPPPKPRIVERKPERPRARQAAAPPPAPPQSSAPNAAPQGAESTPSVSPASWRGSLIAHLNRYKRFPGGANPGTVQIAFSIDRAGRVLSARLAGSSGDPALDEEAVGMIRRASPVPAPPSGVGGSTLTLAVPVRFSR
ncbi:energy transducer TonB family protein [Bosea sp. PAMC 26642]|uniref:energy transducer TonB family protein n=1 Tax=Bosea sp. (strain PAMC 26642) TaxID=1792307 RepID=UPI00077052E3|nr:energy transducer TonB [Bosea sp. PAMC 26642]AMJ59812.1 hypothetical protein AXW83_05395 [Bosea sp. PAMC 26642]